MCMWPLITSFQCSVTRGLKPELNLHLQGVPKGMNVSKLE